jgi:hypothetical protein
MRELLPLTALQSKRKRAGVHQLPQYAFQRTATTQLATG